jgi:glutaredoxin
VDKDGIIQYIDIHDFDLQPSNDELRKVLREIDPGAAAAAKAKPKTPEPASLPDEGIVLYCTPWCPSCRKAHKWLRERNLAYTHVDITKTPGAAQQVMSWANGNRTTPTFFVDGTIIVDWYEDKLVKALIEKGYLKKN